MSEETIIASGSAADERGIVWSANRAPYALDVAGDSHVHARMILPGGLEVLGWEPATPTVTSVIWIGGTDKKVESTFPNPTLGHLIVQTSDGERGRVHVERLKE